MEAHLLLIFSLFIKIGTSIGQIRGCVIENWANKRSDPGKWDLSKYEPGICTHIFYSAANTDDSGNNPKPTEENDLQAGYSALRALKENQKDLKIILSFGGPGYFGFLRFTNESRQNFATNAVRFAKDNGFDGIDIDWEQPSEEYRDRYTQMIQMVRKAAGKEFLVTVTVIPNPRRTYDLPAIAEYVDFLNINPYDNSKPFGMGTVPNTPLYGNEHSTEGFIKAFTKDFPAQKVLLGIQTWGQGKKLKSSKPNQGLHADVESLQLSSKLPSTHISGLIAYFESCYVLQNGGSYYFEEKSRTPYIQKNMDWFSYEDARSVSEKAKYAKEKQLAGVTLFPLTYDDFNDVCKKGRFPLIKEVKKALQ